MNDERWLPVPGWEGLYEVSNLGRVRSVTHTREGRPGVLVTFTGRVLDGWLNKDGYRLVGLNRGPRKTSIGVHRLVLLAFAGPCPDGHEALHGNGHPDDNRRANLRWGTRSENTFDRVRHGTHHQTRKTHCPVGHPYDAENTIYRKTGARRCRECGRVDALRRSRLNRKAA